MLYRFFRSYRPAVIVVLPLFVILLWIPSFQHPPIQRFLFDNAPMPLYRLVQAIVRPDSTVSVVLSVMLLLIQAIQISRINVRYQLIQPPSYLPAVFYLFITSSVLPLHRLNPALLANFFLIAAIAKILSTYKKDELALEFFEAAFLMGTGSMFYAGIGWLIVLPWIALLLLRPFNWREYIFVVTGFGSVYILAVAYHYVFFNDLPVFLQKISVSYFTPAVRWQHVTVCLKWFLSGLAGLGLMTVFFMLWRLQIERVQIRIGMYIFLWTTILLLLVFFFSPSAQIEIVHLLAFPVSIIGSYYFKDYKPRFLAELIFTVCFAMVIALQLGC